MKFARPKPVGGLPTKKKKGSGPISKPEFSLSLQLVDAVNALENNKIVRMVEYKDPHDGKSVHTKDVLYPPELLKGMRGMFPASKIYSFEIHASNVLATVGGGVFTNGDSMSWNPGTVTYGEWSALAALFDEVVLQKATVYINSAFGPTSSAIVFQAVIAPDLDNSSGSTPAYATVQRLSESEYLHPYEMGVKPGIFIKVHKVKNRPYALTSAPTGASGTPSGLLGGWKIASNIVGTPSINYMFAAMKNVVRLRNRA